MSIAGRMWHFLIFTNIGKNSNMGFRGDMEFLIIKVSADIVILVLVKRPTVNIFLWIGRSLLSPIFISKTSSCTLGWKVFQIEETIIHSLIKEGIIIWRKSWLNLFFPPVEPSLLVIMENSWSVISLLPLSKVLVAYTHAWITLQPLILLPGVKLYG